MGDALCVLPIKKSQVRQAPDYCPVVIAARMNARTVINGRFEVNTY
jgi:hypothetical protein